MNVVMKQSWMPLKIRRSVSIKSQGICAICKIRASFAGVDRWKVPKFYDKNKNPFEIDHIIEVRNGGKTEEDNLRLVCPTCNRKRPRLDKKILTDVENILKKFKPIS